jgi:uncharacterized protein YecT (DUF1311 family)
MPTINIHGGSGVIALRVQLAVLDSRTQSAVLNVIIGGLLLICTLLFPVISIAGQAEYQNMCKEGNPFLHCEQAREICKQVESVTIPNQDGPTIEEREKLKECISSVLYYEASDAVLARKCAYLQIEQGRLEGPFDGVPILMRIYANGEGVEPNHELALKFACDDEGGAAAEYEGRVFSINQMRANVDSGRDFDYCNDVTSGLMQGYCAGRDADIEKRKRNAKLAEYMSSWTEGEKRSFEKLRLIWEKYLEVSLNEVDQSGTGRSAFMTAHTELLENNFASSMDEFNQGKFPTYSKEDFAQVDYELNMIYKKIQGRTGDQSLSWGTVTRIDIKNAQRAWLKFRDAWVVFANQKYPLVAAVVWKTWLTRERIELLKEFSETH